VQILGQTLRLRLNPSSGLRLRASLDVGPLVALHFNPSSFQLAEILLVKPVGDRNLLLVPAVGSGLVAAKRIADRRGSNAYSTRYGRPLRRDQR
jgi:hypothetical protein